MAEIISCANDTQLHSFPALEQLSSSAHVDSHGSDCQFFGSSKLFVRANKNSGVEFLRIKEGDPSSASEGTTTRTIAHVRKLSIENLYCVACPKTASREEIAIGLTSGTLRFLNYKTATYTKRFDPDRMMNGVTFMAFNSTDDFLAAVYESGIVNIYGMKTSSKMHSLKFDKNTTKARFHPTKRLHMALASYNGTVTLYDTQAKKTVFSQVGAHGAPCRDVSMVETFPDYLFSVGYDCVINVFDVRRKERAFQIHSNYPFESLAIAEDGYQLAVGNLKGYVYGYDLRSLQEPLNMKKIHQSNVTSLTFVPAAREGSRRSMIELDESRKVTGRGRISEGGAHLNGGAPEKRLERLKLSDSQRHQQQQQPAQANEQHDSFIGEIDIFLQRRDVPLDCVSRLSTSSRLSVESRNSMHMAGNDFMGYLDNLSDCNIDSEPPATMEANDSNGEQSSITAPEPGVDDSFVNFNRLLKRVKATTGRAEISVGDRMGKKGTVESLENIREEDTDNGAESVDEAVEGSSRTASSSNKKSDTNKQLTGASRVLTESQQDNKAKDSHQETRKLSGVTMEAATTSDEKSNKENKKRPSTLNVLPESFCASTPEPSSHCASGGTGMRDAQKDPDQQPTVQQLSSEIAELRQTMLDQLKQNMLQQIDAEEAMKSHLWMGMFNLWRETQRKLDTMEQIVSTGFGLLLPRDEFAQQFLNLKAENLALRKRVNELEGQSRRGK